MRNLMKEAHKLTKEIKKEFPEVDYKAQLGICISYLSKESEENRMKELKGSQKQIKWGESIRKEIIDTCNDEIVLLEKLQSKRVAQGKKRMKVHDKKIVRLKEIIEEVSNIEEARVLIEESRNKYDSYDIRHSLLIK